jgi:hypothetical protein
VNGEFAPASGSMARYFRQQQCQRAGKGSVRFMFDVPQDSKLKGCSAVLGCSTCSEVLSFRSETKSWTCSSCGCEVDLDTLLELASKVKSGLRKLVSDVKHRKGRGRWSLAGLLGRNSQ